MYFEPKRTWNGIVVWYISPKSDLYCWRSIGRLKRSNEIPTRGRVDHFSIMTHINQTHETKHFFATPAYVLHWLQFEQNAQEVFSTISLFHLIICAKYKEYHRKYRDKLTNSSDVKGTTKQLLGRFSRREEKNQKMHNETFYPWT